MPLINGEEYATGRHVIDGELIQVIDKSTWIKVREKDYPSRVQESYANDETKININTADAETLVLLDGVGAAGAKRIIAHRPFTDVQELAKVGGIGQKIIDKNIDLIVL